MSEEAVIFRVPQTAAAAVRRFVRGEPGVDITLEPGVPDAFLARLIESGHPERRFTAKLLHLPTCLEVHKTHDYTHLVKAGAVSRILWLYEETVDAGSADVVVGPGSAPTSIVGASNVFTLVPDPTPGSSDVTVDSGLTPPMQHASQRRFRKAHRFIGKHDARLVSEAERVLLDLMVHDSYEHVVEELVDAEAWMEPWFRGGGDNVTIRYEDGEPVEIYQLQPAVSGGVSVRTLKGAGEMPPPFVLTPNPDGTFGGRSAAAAAAARAVAAHSRIVTTQPTAAAALSMELPAEGLPSATGAHGVGGHDDEMLGTGAAPAADGFADVDSLLGGDEAEFIALLNTVDASEDLELGGEEGLGGAEGSQDPALDAVGAGLTPQSAEEAEVPVIVTEESQRDERSQGLAVALKGDAVVAGDHSSELAEPAVNDSDATGEHSVFDAAAAPPPRTAEETEAIVRASLAGRALLEQRDAASAELAKAVGAHQDAKSKAENARTNPAFKQLLPRLESAAQAKSVAVATAEARLAALNAQLNALVATL